MLATSISAVLDDKAGAFMRAANHLAAPDDMLRGRIEGGRHAMTLTPVRPSKGLDERLGLARRFGFRKRAAGKAGAFDARQRAIVKVHYFSHGGGGGGALSAHVRYVSRDAAQAEREPEVGDERTTAEDRRAELDAHMRYLARGEDGSVFYDAARIGIDGAARTQEWARRDKRHFRIILAADEAERLKDLRPFVREVMARAEQTLGSKLEWIAVDHFETDNPHTHIILRGRTAEASSTGGAPVTNIRNLASPHWRAILGPAHRYLVPFTEFSEYDDASPKGAKQIRWFAPRDRGLLMFAGIWRSWTGDYGSKKEPNEGKHLLFSFLTTEPNDIVRPIHAKAMPVVLIGRDEQEEWLSAPADRIADIQARPIVNDALEVLDEEEASAYGGAYIK